MTAAGRTYPAYRYEVSREKIREYAAAVGETDPRYFSDGDDCVAPPTFAACFTLAKAAVAVLADDALTLHPGLVHTSQSYRFGGRPVRPGDVLICTPAIGPVTERAGSQLLTLEVDCRFADTGELAVRTTSGLLAVAPVGL